MNEKNLFSQRLKARRSALGLSLQNVADVVGVTRSTVQRWESGEISNVKRERIILLSRALYCSASYLMGWTEELTPVAESASRVDELFSQLAPEDQEAALRYMEFLLSRRLEGGHDA